jgi:hypothetical protein
MKTTLLIAFSFVTLSAFAQNYGTPPPPPPNISDMPDVWGSRYFHFGLNITPGVYWISPNTSNNSANGASLGFGYGANLEFYFTRNYGFLTGFEITNIGAKYISSYSNPTPAYVDSSITQDESLQYLQIPLMLKMKTNPIGRIRYYGEVGFEAGFLLKATDDYTYTNTPYITIYPRSYSVNNADIYSQTDFFRVSLVIGLGAEYSIAGSSALQACLTYNSCFTNLNNTSSSAVNVKGVELMLGVLF